jgi:hypothetical protein
MSRRRPHDAAHLLGGCVLYVGDRFLLRFTVANAAWEIGDESRGLCHRTPPTVGSLSDNHERSCADLTASMNSISFPDMYGLIGRRKRTVKISLRLGQETL